tara:strand:+ start:3095 stop:3358 length:264 start_codon:yes stop_codon:yes gene_type:complete
MKKEIQLLNIVIKFLKIVGLIFLSVFFFHLIYGFFSFNKMEDRDFWWLLLTSFSLIKVFELANRYLDIKELEVNQIHKIHKVTHRDK